MGAFCRNLGFYEKKIAIRECNLYSKKVLFALFFGGKPKESKVTNELSSSFAGTFDPVLNFTVSVIVSLNRESFHPG